MNQLRKESLRLGKMAARASERRAGESQEEKEIRLPKMAARASERRVGQSQEEKEIRLGKMVAHASEKRAEQKRTLENLRSEFPPVISEEVKNMCLSGFIEATSFSKLPINICAVCASRCNNYESICVDELPGSQLLRHGNTGLPEYRVGDSLLHKGGVDDDHIKCCRDCLADLKKNKLPSTSIANNFQVGECPSVLTDLKLPEKILIALYRPKLYVTTIRSVVGPQSAQRGLKGNTISYPQDIVGISNKVPASTDVLADTIKVVFIESNRPSKELLKKIFQCV